MGDLQFVVSYCCPFQLGYQALRRWAWRHLEDIACLCGHRTCDEEVVQILAVVSAEPAALVISVPAGPMAGEKQVVGDVEQVVAQLSVEECG